MLLKKKSSKGRWIQFSASMVMAVAAVLQLHGPRHILIGLAMCAVGGAIGVIVLLRRARRESVEAASAAGASAGSPSASDVR